MSRILVTSLHRTNKILTPIKPQFHFIPKSLSISHVSYSTKSMPTNAELRNTPANSNECEKLLSTGWSIKLIEKDNTNRLISMTDLKSAGEDGKVIFNQPVKLERTLKFKNFEVAWGFMTRVALAAEKLNVGSLCFLPSSRSASAPSLALLTRFLTNSIASSRMVKRLQ